MNESIFNFFSKKKAAQAPKAQKSEHDLPHTADMKYRDAHDEHVDHVYHSLHRARHLTRVGGSLYRLNKNNPAKLKKITHFHNTVDEFINTHFGEKPPF